MKTMRYRIFVLWILCAIVSSCQKEFENPNDPSTNTAVNFKAKINGTQFSADISSAVLGTGGIISLTGKSNDGQLIVFAVADSGMHVYTLDINSIANVDAYSIHNDIAFTSNGGTTSFESGGNLAIVTIDPVNRLISGTFNFKAFRKSDKTQKTITEGVFNNISY